MAESVLRQRVAALDATSQGVSSSAASTSSGSSTPTSEDFDPMTATTFTPPKFTIKELLGAIPAHCFERSAIKSSAFLLMDILMVFAFGTLALGINSRFGFNGEVLNGWAGEVTRWFLWSQYFWWCGCAMTGIWVIAHECGHQAYSSSKFINNTVGWFAHSALLVPYHSWRISHAKHHAATGHMTRDEVFVPKTRSQLGVRPATEEEKKNGGSVLSDLDDLLEDSPAYALLMLFAQQLFGWPAYLMTNASGSVKYPAWTNHFDPKSLVFDARHRRDILVSDAGIALAFAALGTWAHYRGIGEVIALYFVPYLIVNHHLVMVTFLQHTDPALPHYRDGEWNFQRGALCTVDRNTFGFVGPYLFHGIAETHVLHHLCSKIPHYHAWEATEALKKVLGKEYYFKSDENVLVSLYKNYRYCKFVEDEGTVVFYKDVKGRAKKTVVYENGHVSDSGVDVQEPEEIE